MGLYDRAYYRDDEDRQGFLTGGGAASSRPIFVTLMIINVVVFFADTLFLDRQLSVGQGRGMFAASAADLLNPLLWWRFLTAGFVHDPADMMHLIGNMIGLFFFGRAIEQTYGPKKFLAFYLTAIVLGNLGFALRSWIVGSGTPVIGASGGVTAVIILFALRHPRQTILFMMMFPMPAWVLGIFIVVRDVMTSFGNSNVAADVHLIGAAYGFLFFKTGWDFTSLGFSRLSSFKMPKRRPKMRIYDPQSKQGNLDQLADELLEKVHREGQDSLTSKERRILEDYSRRMKQKHS